MTDTEIKFDADGYGPTLHKRDSKGKHRKWQMQITSGGSYRTLSGLADGKQAVSGWTVPTRKSQDTVREQGEFEVRAKYQHQLDREYHISADTIGEAKMIEPMLAKKYGKFPGPGYAQPKLDGMRCIMTKDGMFTRQGRPITAVPHLQAGAAAFFEQFPAAVLDGELYNHDLRDDFQKLMSICRKKNPTTAQLVEAEVVEYHVYDLISEQPFSNRTLSLRTHHDSGLLGWAELVPTLFCRDQQMFDAAYAKFIEDGYEGGMFRPDGDPGYQLGARSAFLLKRKDFDTEEFEVDRVEGGKGNWTGAAKRFVLLNNTPAGETFGAGVRGTREDLTRLLLETDQYGPPSHATVRFFGRSNDGVPRFPVVIDWHMKGRKD